MKLIIVLTLVVVALSAVVKREAPGVIVLPDGAELIVGGVKSGFSCANRIYGYYADVDNACRIFHVCVHHVDPENSIDDTQQYSFFCGNQTIFDQANLVCVFPDDTADLCSVAPGLYDAVNGKFGIIDKTG